MSRRARGFTLLELLIALAIFGLLSVMSYSGLKGVLDQHARTDEGSNLGRKIPLPDSRFREQFQLFADVLVHDALDCTVAEDVYKTVSPRT